MINSRPAGAALIVATAVAATACAAPGPGTPVAAPPSSPPASVAPDCDPAGARVRWAQPAREPRLTRVILFRTAPGASGGRAGEEVFDAPFTPSVAQVAAPAGWTARLAESLGRKTGDKIHTGPARAKDGTTYGVVTPGQDDPGIPEKLLYEGVETVSAGFTVDCRPPVSGTFTSWTSASVAGVSCGSAAEPAEALGRLARRYCPRTPSPRPSSVEAVPFDTAPAG